LKNVFKRLEDKYLEKVLKRLVNYLEKINLEKRFEKYFEEKYLEKCFEMS